MRRVVVTGVGVISALGRDRVSFWNALASGQSGIAAIEGLAPGTLRFPNGAQVRDYDPAAHFEPKDAAMLDRFAQFGVIAAREAVAETGLAITGPRTAIVTGCSVGGQESEDAQFEELYRKSTGRVHPMTIPRIMGNAGASRISMEMGITGPVYNISTACSSSNHAIGNAFWMVRNGIVDRAVTGGSEAIFSYGFLKAWEAMRVVSPDTCRPFSVERHGMILGEGAAMLVLESREAAISRSAHIYAEIVGFGMSSDAHHVTQPQAEGAARAMQAALDDAGVAPEQVGYINAHGTGTAANDPTEVAAIRNVFGAHAEKLALSSTKSMHGHALGAAGALEAAATALTLDRGLLPPTANFLAPDPACDLDVIPNVARPAKVECAMSNSFAFGGLNAVLLFRAAACLLLMLLTPGRVHAATCSAPAPQVLAGYRQMYDLSFDTAHKTFAEWKRNNPTDPMGPVSDGAAYLFSEFERLHILESEFFVNDNSFRITKKLTPDPAIKTAFDREMAASHQLTARALAKDRSDPTAMLTEVMARGMESDYLALVEKRYISSLDEMKSSRKMAEQLLTAHPDCADANLAVGLENYILSTKAAPLRWILRLGGAQTDQEQGIVTLRKTAQYGVLLQPFARLLLAVAALRKQDKPGAIHLLEGLVAEFPHNHLYTTELAKLKSGK